MTVETPMLPEPVARPRRSLVRRWLVGGALVVVFLLAALLLAAAIGAQLGAQATLYALVLAVVPPGIVVPAFLALDRLEAEPTRYLVFAFGWGALVAAAVALVLNTGSMLVLESMQFDGQAVGAVLVAPVVEESLKGLGVLVVLWRHREEFDGVVDGIVYAGVTAAGFAFMENILYLGEAFLEAGAAGLVALFVVRGLLSPFAHPMFTMWFGAGVGLAASRRGIVTVLAPVGGFLVAVLLHGLWNLSSVAGMEGFWTSYLLLQVPLFVLAIGFVLFVRRSETRVLRRNLQLYAQYGWFTPAEVEMLTSTPARRAARAWARGAGGPVGKRTMTAFQDRAIDLALLRKRMEHGTAGPAAQQEEMWMLQVVGATRAQLP